jgi:hypothetical protein
MDEIVRMYGALDKKRSHPAPEHPQQWAWSTATVNGRHTEREHERNPREEEVPREEDEGGLADPVDSDNEQPDRGEGQRGESEGQPRQPVHRPRLRGTRHTSTLEGQHQRRWSVGYPERRVDRVAPPRRPTLFAVGLLNRSVDANWFEAVGTWVGAGVTLIAVIAAAIVFVSEGVARRPRGTT